MTEINPFARSLHDLKADDTENLTPRPRFVAHLREPVRALSKFHSESQDFLRYLMDRGELACMERDGDLYVSWYDLNPYLSSGSDPTDWDEK